MRGDLRAPGGSYGVSHNTVTLVEQPGLLPEGSHQARAATHAPQSSSGMLAERRVSIRAEVGECLFLPVPPQELDRIQFWGVGRELLADHPARLPFQGLPDQPAAVAGEAVPDDQRSPRRGRERCCRKSTTCGPRTAAGWRRK